jgi:hypothetical protein
LLGGPSTPVQAAYVPTACPKGTLGSIPHSVYEYAWILRVASQGVGYNLFKTFHLELPLPASLKTLVSAYVRSKNRQALENMRELRRQLLEPLQSTSGINAAQSRSSILEDLRVIEEGLEQIRPPGRG